jgi:uncharacterized protein (UPF0305 family)
MKSLINQLIEAKRTNNEDTYESIHEEMTNQLETLCNSFTENDVTKESITELADFIEQYSKSLREYADDL